MTVIRRPTAVDLALLVLTALIWAAAFVAIKVAVPETGPWWLAAHRVVLGFLVLFPIALFAGLRLPKTRGSAALLFLMAILNMVIPFVLIAWAETRITAGVTSLLMGAGPFMALVLSHLFTADDKLTWRKTAAMAMGFGGVALVVGYDALAGLGQQSLPGQAAALTASLCYVTAGLLIRRIDLDPLSMAALSLAIGSAALVALAFLMQGPPAADLSAPALQALLFLGALPTGLAYLLRFHLIRTIGYSTFALAIYLIPVFGVLLGWLMLGEELSVRTLAALALVVSGLFVARGTGSLTRPSRARIPYRRSGGSGI